MNNKLEQLVQNLLKDGVIKSEVVKQTFQKIDRKEFVDDNDHKFAYEDYPLQIGYNATISAPHMHAYSLVNRQLIQEFLKDHLQNGTRALDIGSGSGYLCAAMKLMMNSGQSKVVGVEHVPQLVQKSLRNLQKSFSQHLADKSILIIQGDGRQGYEQEGPYQAIHVGAAAETMPQKLIDQLDKGGRMVIPVGKGNQVFQVVDKDLNGKVNISNVLGVRYVPLTDLKKQWDV